MPSLSSSSGAAARVPGRAARRRSILEAAQVLFARYGFRRASMHDVAREAGISRAALYLHFATKEALFRALVERLHAGALEVAAEAAAHGAPLEARLGGVLEAKAVPLFELLRRSPHAAEFVDENHRLCGAVSARAAAAYGRLLTRLLRDADRAGELHLEAAGVTAEAAAELLLDVLDGLKGRARVALTVEQFRRRLRQSVRVVVAGLRRPPRPARRAPA